jgi:hypothetical protein
VDLGLHLHLLAMNKLLLVSLLFIWPVAALACPNCHAALNDGKPPYTVIILGIFILVTYIPFYILFSAAKKYDPKNNGVNE